MSQESTTPGLVELTRRSFVAANRRAYRHHDLAFADLGLAE
jgi:hypothetical protein